MKFIPYLILVFLFLACSETSTINESELENNTNNETLPFPKHYEGFYAGMTINEFENIAYNGFYTILNNRKNWQVNEGNTIEIPGLIIYSDGITISADYWDDKIAKIQVEGSGIKKFGTELQDILDNFEGETKTTLSNGAIATHPENYTFEQGELRTIIDSKESTMTLIKLPLNWELLDEYSIRQKAHDKKVKAEIQSKYQ